MGLFGGKKDNQKKAAPDRQEKPTTARRSRRIVQPGAAKSGGSPGATKARSPEPQVRRNPKPAPAAEARTDEVLQLDDFASSPPPPQRQGAPQALPSHEVPDLDFQGDLGGAADSSGPSRTGDAALIEFLVDKVELITKEQAQNAQQLAYDEGLPIDAALVQNGSIGEDALVAALTKECWVPHLKVDKYEIRKKALSTISVEDARRFGVFPVDKLGSILNLAMVNPLDEEAISHIESKTGLEVKKVVASRSEFQACVDKYFGGGVASAQSDSSTDGSRMFSQDLPASTNSATQQLEQAHVSPAAAPEPAMAMDDFMDIADIDDLLGDGDEVTPALIEPVALEPLENEPSFVQDSGPSSEDIFHDLTDTSAVEPEPQAAAEEVLDLEFQPEPSAPEPAATSSSDDFFNDLGDLEPLPAASTAPAPSPAPRSPSRSATKSFTAKPASSLSMPSQQAENLLPVTEEEFQNSIAHGRVRIFEKWIGIQTRNRILNASPVDPELDPLLAGLKESPYAVSA